MSDVAERFVACAGWRWLPGMRYRYEHWSSLWPSVRVSDHPEHASALVHDGESESTPLPDVNDPGTLGCIEHGLLPAAYGPECTVTLDLDVRVTSGYWAATLHVWDASDIDNPTHAFDARGTTRTEALAAVLLLALEGAPS